MHIADLSISPDANQTTKEIQWKMHTRKETSSLESIAVLSIDAPELMKKARTLLEQSHLCVTDMTTKENSATMIKDLQPISHSMDHNSSTFDNIQIRQKKKISSMIPLSSNRIQEKSWIDCHPKARTSLLFPGQGDMNFEQESISLSEDMLDRVQSKDSVPRDILNLYFHRWKTLPTVKQRSHVRRSQLLRITRTADLFYKVYLLSRLWRRWSEKLLEQVVRLSYALFFFPQTLNNCISEGKS